MLLRTGACPEQDDSETGRERIVMVLQRGAVVYYLTTQKDGASEGGERALQQSSGRKLSARLLRLPSGD